MIGAIIPAGGAGTRMGTAFKPFLPLRGRPLLDYSLQLFLGRSDISQIVVALPPAILASPPDWLRHERVTLVQGGRERMDSVRHGLAALNADIDVVIVHDAARPLLSDQLLTRVLAQVGAQQGAIAARPVSDTVHVTDGTHLLSTPDRSALWQAQTPQIFPRQLLALAHERAQQDDILGTDDAALVVRVGGRVVVVEGESRNLKITRPEDLQLAQLLLEASS